jgi:peptide chain release factor 2
MNAIKRLGGIFDFDIKKSRLDQISKELEDPSIWNDQGRSQTLGKEKRELDFIVNGLSNLAANLKDQVELFELARNENDDETLKVVLDESHSLEKSVEICFFVCI